ncbi:phasin family protein [Bradyrhizobium sp. AZCC 2230]|uniref:phasin family protein n=1 Tax=Bradyrhizobium sp. AZCC 2230 TaxID=3117021 RepID=UPI002FF16E03
MSKSKLTTGSKRVRNPKKAAQAQQNKQDVVRSPKANLSNSVAAASIESPLEHDPKQDAPFIETRVDPLPADLSQRMTDSDPTKGLALATVNVQAYQAKLLEIAHANWQFAFEFGLRLAATRSPTEFFTVITEFTSRQIDMFGQHAKEMAAYPFWRIDASRELPVRPGQ